MTNKIERTGMKNPITADELLKDGTRLQFSFIHKLATEPMAITIDGGLTAALNLMCGDPTAYVNSIRNAAGQTPPERRDSLSIADNSFQLTADMFGNPVPQASLEGSTAVVPLKGTVVKGGGNLGRFLGMAELNQFTAELDDAVRSDKVESILLNIDSPGGFTTGVAEAANAVDKAAKQKPVVAYTESMMGSAAYWIGAGATKLFATPSSVVGSIGAFLQIADVSEMLDRMGVKMIMIKSGKYKGTGTAGQPVTKDQVAFLQDRINKTGEAFRSFVSDRRTMIKREDMEGQVFNGDEAASRGFVGATVQNLQEAIEKI